MLQEYNDHISGYKDTQYLHWNMRDVNFGFQALEHRARVHGIEPCVVPDSCRLDLSRLLVQAYGTGYIGHPRLKKLLEKNHIEPLDFLSGEAEAEAFERGDYVALHQSTLRKVDVLANLAGRAHTNSLRTNATWWELRGGTVRAALEWMAFHPIWSIGTGIVTLASFAAALLLS